MPRFVSASGAAAAASEGRVTNKHQNGRHKAHYASGGLTVGTATLARVAADWVTPQEAAAILGVTDKRVYALIAERRLPSERIGGRILMPRAAVERWPKDGKRPHGHPVTSDAPRAVRRRERKAGARKRTAK